MGYYCKTKNFDSNFWIAFLLMIFSFNILAPIFVFYKFGMDFCHAILCIFLPPLGIIFGVGNCGKTCLCICLTIFGFLPGVIYAFH